MPDDVVALGSLRFFRPPDAGPGWTPVLNTACPWADDLEQLYANPYINGVTTRTAYLHGSKPLDSIYDPHPAHSVSLSQPNFSLNSYGYSP